MAGVERLGEEKPMLEEAKVVLVTGSSSGFGDLSVRTLAKVGHRVFATMREIDSRNREPAVKLDEWAKQEGVALEVVELDVLDHASVGNAVETIVASAGRIDVVVNNAGAGAVGPIEAFSMEQIKALFDLNVFGPLRVNKAVLPLMRKQRSGLIIHVTSTLGRILPRRGGLYPATKWAVEGLAESLRYQVERFGIDVVILEPGSFPTPAMGKAMIASEEGITEEYAEAEAKVPRRSSPPGPDYRLPDPQDVADAVEHIVALPAGQRPLRVVAGPVFTKGVDEFNAMYERARDGLAEWLKRPDQTITWSRPSDTEKDKN
jgi:NAD(P)-dependent dehydrogenase (short-subunit alcohol dehydrogenase family)